MYVITIPRKHCRAYDRDDDACEAVAKTMFNQC